MFAQREIHWGACAQHFAQLRRSNETQAEKRNSTVEQQFFQAVGMTAKRNYHDSQL